MRQVHLDLDQATFQAEDGGGGDAGQHGFSKLVPRASRQASRGTPRASRGTAHAPEARLVEVAVLCSAPDTTIRSAAAATPGNSGQLKDDVATEANGRPPESPTRWSSPRFAATALTYQAGGAYPDAECSGGEKPPC